MTTRIQRSFAGGVLSPALRSRVDLSKFQSGLAEGKNVFIQRYGGVANRPGTTLLTGGAPNNRLISMILSNTGNTIFLGLSHKRMVIENNLPVSTPWSVEEIPDIQYTISADVVTFVHPSHPVYELRYFYGPTVIPGLFDYQYSFGVQRRRPGIKPPENVKITKGDATGSLQLGRYAVTSIDRNSYEESFPAQNIAGRVARDAHVRDITIGWDALDEAVEYNVYRRVNGVYHLLGVARTNSFVDIGQAPDSSITPPTFFGGGGENFDFEILDITKDDPAVVTVARPIDEDIDPAGLGLDNILRGRRIVFEDVPGMTELNSKVFVIGDVRTGDALTSTIGEITPAGIFLEFDLLNGNGDNVDSSGFTAYRPDINIRDNPRTRQPDGRLFSIDDKPSAVAYYQQRLCFAGTNSEPEQVRTSRTGQFKNFTSGRPPRADDSVIFRIASGEVGRIRHLVDLELLIVLTERAEIVVRGDEAGLLTPDSVNLKRESSYGSSRLRPLKVGKTALYAQYGGSIIRDIGYDYQADGYSGNDLTIFSSHFFEGRSIIDWTYQSTPHSLIWAVRDDGVLLSLTYLRDQEILAWCEHEIPGFKVNSVAYRRVGVDEGLYLSVVDAEGAVSILTMNLRDPEALNGDGRGFMDFTHNLIPENTFNYHIGSDDGDWSADGAEIYLSRKTISFRAGNDPLTGNILTDIGPGDFIEMTKEGSTVRFEVLSLEPERASGFHTVRVAPDRDVPESFRGSGTLDSSATKNFSYRRISKKFRAPNFFTGRDIAVVADGNVVANPLNPSYDVITPDENNNFELKRLYNEASIGLPYISDIETLDVEDPGDGTYAGKEINIQNVVLYVDRSRGIFVGGRKPKGDDLLDGLVEHKTGSDEGEDVFDSPKRLQTGEININIESEWNSNGRVFVRQIDPLPLSISAIAPSGLFPDGRD